MRKYMSITLSTAGKGPNSARSGEKSRTFALEIATPAATGRAARRRPEPGPHPSQPIPKPPSREWWSSGIRVRAVPMRSENPSMALPPCPPRQSRNPSPNSRKSTTIQQRQNGALTTTSVPVRHGKHARLPTVLASCTAILAGPGGPLYRPERWGHTSPSPQSSTSTATRCPPRWMPRAPGSSPCGAASMACRADTGCSAA